jgi:hypothetical protein
MLSCDAQIRLCGEQKALGTELRPNSIYLHTVIYFWAYDKIARGYVVVNKKVTTKRIWQNEQVKVQRKH